MTPAPHSASRTAPIRLLSAVDYDRSTLGLFLVVFVAILATFTDYGVSWDEDVHFWYGFRVLDYYTTLFSDGQALNSPPIHFYGAAFDATTALLSKISPLGGYETRHLLNALIGLTGLVGCWKLARHLAGPRAGFLAALLLVLMPNYYGHMFNNPKDIPFAVAGVWALYYMVRILPWLPRPDWRDVPKLGLAIGLGLGIRVGALLFICYFGFAVLASLILHAHRIGRPLLIVEEGLITIRRVLLPMLLMAYPVMLLFWPWAQLNPFTRPFEALAEFSHHPFPYNTIFNGAYYPAYDLPWLYLPVNVLIKLPELVVALLAIAVPCAVWRLAMRPQPSAVTIVSFSLVGIAALFPIAYAVAIHATLFDGMRHFLFVLPPLAAIAGITLDRLANGSKKPWLRAAVPIALTAHIGLQLELMARLHPDEYVYYNRLVGGVPGAAGRFKLDYWANSYREAVLDLAQWLEMTEGERFAWTSYSVSVCGPQGSAIYFMPPNFRYEPERQKADFYIAFTKDNCNRSIPGREIGRVERMGTLLSVVLDLRQHEMRAGLATGGP